MTDRPLSVVQLVPTLESGGVERGTLEVARELVRRGHRSVVISGGGRMVDQLTAEGSEHLEWPIGEKSPATAWCVPRLRRWLKSQQIDVLHARSRVPAWIGWLTWRSLPYTTRPRFVTTVHGINSVNRFSRIMTQGEAVVAVSEAVREHIRRNYGDVPDDRVHVIPRGVDPADFPYGYRPSDSWQEDWERQYPQLSGREILTLAGRITRLKGHHDFLRLLADLKDRNRAVHGLIVGGEDPRRRQYAAEVKRRVEELGLTHDVTFAGHRADVRDVYAVSDVVLSLSTKPESFGRTTLEPLALGVPVVGYDHGGVGEILNAVFPTGAVPLSDEATLCERVSLILEDARLRPEPFREFRLQEMLDGTLALYRRLANELQGTRRVCRAA